MSAAFVGIGCPERSSTSNGCIMIAKGKPRQVDADVCMPLPAQASSSQRANIQTKWLTSIHLEPASRH